MSVIIGMIADKTGVIPMRYDKMNIMTLLIIKVPNHSHMMWECLLQLCYYTMNIVMIQ